MNEIYIVLLNKKVYLSKLDWNNSFYNKLEIAPLENIYKDTRLN